MNKKILNIAHRGASGLAPENTISAFLKAVEAGADIIELDVQFSKDSELIVTHDKTIKRFTGIDKNVNEFEFNYLKELDFGSWFSPEFKGEKIPSLREVFEKIGPKIRYDIEIKLGEKTYPGITKSVVNLVNKFKVMDNVLISSFDLDAIKKLREIDKKITAGIIFNKNDWNYYLKIAQKFDCQFIVPEKGLITESNISKAHSIGLSVYPYVSDKEEEILRLIQSDVDGIITNRPDILSATIRKLKSE